MTGEEIAQRRLRNQQIARPRLDAPEAVVRWLGAVQAQDYAGAKWALGLRVRATPGSPDPTNDAVEQLVCAGTILRTHVLRPTWHFVAPADIRWLLALTAPRVNAANAYYYRQNELDDAVFARSQTVLLKTLEGGRQCTRPELVAVLEQAGISMAGLRSGLILMRAELDGVLCSGARRGKQFTYALLEERAPVVGSQSLAEEAALAELTRRYFASHGPATLQDFAWWSGLAPAVVRAMAASLEAEAELARETIDGRSYWLAPEAGGLVALATPDGVPPAIYLLPSYDEYVVAYKDRGAVFDPGQARRLGAGTRPVSALDPVIVCEGRIIGFWKRSLAPNEVVVEVDPFRPLSGAETEGLAAAAARYGRFLGLPARLA